MTALKTRLAALEAKAPDSGLNHCKVALMAHDDPRAQEALPDDDPKHTVTRVVLVPLKRMLAAAHATSVER